MEEKATPISDIIGIDIPPGGESPYADILLGSLSHITNARPFFALLNDQEGKLVWTSGGAEFSDFIHDCNICIDGGKIDSCKSLYESFGFSTEDSVKLTIAHDDIGPGESIVSPKPLKGRDGRYFRISSRRRTHPNEHLVQVSVHEITPFIEVEKNSLSTAKDIIHKLGLPLKGGDSTLKQLKHFLDELDTLFSLKDDDSIHAKSEEMSTKVTYISERIVSVLRNIEETYDKNHWQPKSANNDLRPVIPMHESPVSDWNELQESVLECANGKLGINSSIVENLKNAYSFVKNADSTFIISPSPDEIIILNGSSEGRSLKTVSDLVNELGVEANSVEIANEFFNSLSQDSSMSLFSANNEIVQAWGRPNAFGWQSNLIKANTVQVDVRGLFHGIKNLLLHLQILYVIKNKADVEEIRSSLSNSARAIRDRLNELEAIAKTGQRTSDLRTESVGEWLESANQVAKLSRNEISISASDKIRNLKFTVPPYEMNDTISELVQNAFNHNATKVEIHANIKEKYLHIVIQDNGTGISPKKLRHIKKVLASGHHDPTLSTRENGTGNGLLSAHKAMRNILDGSLDVEHGKNGSGTRVVLLSKIAS